MVPTPSQNDNPLPWYLQTTSIQNAKKSSIHSTNLLSDENHPPISHKTQQEQEQEQEQDEQDSSDPDDDDGDRERWEFIRPLHSRDFEMRFLPNSNNLNGIPTLEPEKRSLCGHSSLVVGQDRLLLLSNNDNKNPSSCSQNDHDQDDYNGRKPRQRRKRPRWEYDYDANGSLLYSTANIIVGNDVIFTPFQGSIQDLVKHIRPLSAVGYHGNDSNRSLNQDHGMSGGLFRFMTCSMVGVLVCWIVLHLLFQKGERKSVTDDENISETVDTSCGNLHSHSHSQLELASQLEARLERVSLPQPASQMDLKPNKNQLEVESSMITSTVDLSWSGNQLYNNCDDGRASTTMEHTQIVQSLFTNDIPAMASVIAKTGLNRQDSLRIATEQVLSAQRRAFEKVIMTQGQELEECKNKANQEVTRFHKSLVSAMMGSHLMLCLVMGCATRAIVSNFPMLYVLFVNKDGNAAMQKLWETVFYWFVTEICQCLDSSCNTCKPSVEDTTPYITAYGMYLLNYIGMPSFASFVFSTSIPIATCMMRCLVQMILLGLSHRVLTIFHSKLLHQILNMVVVLYLTICTSEGRTVLALVLQIVGYNITCCIVAFYYRGKNTTWASLSMSKDLTMDDYANTIENASVRRKILLMLTCLGSIILAAI